jgi:hypothetical protein
MNDTQFIYLFIVAEAFISQINTQCMYIKLITHNSIVMFSQKILHPGGIRTRVFCSWGGCDVHCAMPPGLDKQFKLQSLLST